MDVYGYVLGVLLVICAVLGKQQYDGLKGTVTTTEFKMFQRKFLSVYVLMTAADWIQGPYLYKLYVFYGFPPSDIGFLFVIGFVSSAVFGTLVGGLSDRFGRKKTCVIFTVLYALCCLNKHSSNFSFLVLGRVLGGIATSILFSVFEAWMSHEHKVRGFPDEWMIQTVSYMSFLSSLAAVVCSILAGLVVSWWGYVAPFDTAVVFLAVGGVMIIKMWPENFGDEASVVGSNFAVGWVVMTSSSKIWLLGVVQSCFESAMYLFVFSWTPILEDSGEDIPHGLIFGSFMVAIMIGTYVFQHALKTYRLEDIMKVNALVASITLAIPAFTAMHLPKLLAFCVYEMCVGVYFPAIAYLRSTHIPKEVRATVANLFRIPLNSIVVVVLLKISNMDIWVKSLSASALLFMAFIAQVFIASASNKEGTTVNTVVKEQDVLKQGTV
mmetsp:Transcript_6689/g.10544  ORF Transcript_6689/g.10544 Transcript_6689/m.10544 type:complete len:438 (-) Transcript_6689:2567-3880(-)